MRQLAIFTAVFMVIAVSGTANAQNSKVIRQLQSENASLKRTVTVLQKRLGALSTRIRRLEKKSTSASSTGAASANTKNLNNRLKKIERVVRISNSGVVIKASPNLRLEAAASTTIKGGANVTVEGGGRVTIKGGTVWLGGAGGKPIARVGDHTLTSPGGGPGKVLTGSPTVFAK